MSEFIVIAPSDYTEVDIDSIVNATGFMLAQLKDLEESQQYSELTEKLKEAGMIPENTEVVTGLKLIEDKELYLKFD